MKIIPLKKMTIDGRDFTYCEQLMTVLTAPSNRDKGAEYEEMCKVIPIYQKLKEAKDEDSITLEDEEHKVLCDKLKKTGYQSNTVEIYQFIKDVIDSPSPDKKEK